MKRGILDTPKASQDRSDIITFLAQPKGGTVAKYVTDLMEMSGSSPGPSYVVPSGETMTVIAATKPAVGECLPAFTPESVATVWNIPVILKGGMQQLVVQNPQAVFKSYVTDRDFVFEHAAYGSSDDYVLTGQSLHDLETSHFAHALFANDRKARLVACDGKLYAGQQQETVYFLRPIVSEAELALLPGPESLARSGS